MKRMIPRLGDVPGSELFGPRERVAGQAYTEYLVILLFGVFVALGISLVGAPGLPDTLPNTLLGYIFDHYEGLANYLNLPFF
jgi:hypothetical protein